MNPPHDQRPAPRPPESWKVEIWLRIRRHFALKAIGTTAFTWLFFIGYFHLLREPASPVAVMPLTALDPLIPFQPPALIAYFSLWLYVGFAPGPQPVRHEFPEGELEAGREAHVEPEREIGDQCRRLERDQGCLLYTSDAADEL